MPTFAIILLIIITCFVVTLNINIVLETTTKVEKCVKQNDIFNLAMILFSSLTMALKNNAKTGWIII